MWWVGLLGCRPRRFRLIILSLLAVVVQVALKVATAVLVVVALVDLELTQV
jgi:hypothetical protein